MSTSPAPAPPRYYGCSGEHVGRYQYAVRRDGDQDDAPPILCADQDLSLRIPTLLNGWSTGDLKVLADLATDCGGAHAVVNLVEIGRQRLRRVRDHYNGLDDDHIPHTPDGEAWYDAIPLLDVPVEDMADTIDGHPVVDDQDD